MVSQTKVYSLVLLFVFAAVFFLFACSNQGQETSEQTSNVQAEHQMAAAPAQDEAAVKVAAWNKVCPVTGEEVSSDAPTVMYEGKAYGFCCPGCDDKFKDDPQHYSKNLSEDGTTFVGKKS